MGFRLGSTQYVGALDYYMYYCSTCIFIGVNLRFVRFLLVVLLELRSDLLPRLGDDQLLQAVLEGDVEQTQLLGQLSPMECLTGPAGSQDQQANGRGL